MSWQIGLLAPWCSGKLLLFTVTLALKSHAPMCNKMRTPSRLQAAGNFGNFNLYHRAAFLLMPEASGGRNFFSKALDSEAPVPESSDCKQNGTVMFPSHSVGC